MKTQLIFNLPFLSERKPVLTKELETVLFKEKNAFIATVNAKHIIEMEKSRDFEAALHSASYIIPDGVGIMKASHYYDTPLPEKIPGVELMEDLLQLAHRHEKKIYLFGAKEKVLKELIRRIQIKYPKVTICGSRNGYDYDEAEVVEEIKALEPDIVFVALGVPKQEVFIANHFQTMKKGIWIGVGGSFDVLSGYVRRAPLLWRKMQLEWLYRITANPKRFTQSHFLLLYALKVLKEKRKWQLQKNPDHLLIEE